MINGIDTEYLGRGDFHETSSESNRATIQVLDSQAFDTFSRSYTGLPINREYCPMFIEFFPSDTYASRFVTDAPMIMAVSTVAVCIVLGALFFLYIHLSKKAQEQLERKNAETTAIVNSLIPVSVRKQIFDKDRGAQALRRVYLKNDDGDDSDLVYESKPIADFFPETTVMYARITGFTSWSSTRQPSQVFVLLETIFGSFDDIGSYRRIFKVEASGECYVAALGVPEARKDHAVAMIRFAKECMDRYGQTFQNFARILILSSYTVLSG